MADPNPFDTEIKKKLGSMHKAKIKEVMRRKSKARQVSTWLTALRGLTPVLYLALLAWCTCLQADPLLNVEWTYKDALRFATLDQNLRNSELLHSLNAVHSRNPLTGEGAFRKQSINGWQVCDTCFQRAYGISEVTWWRRKRDVRNGIQAWEHGNCGNEGRYSDKGFLSRAWMSSFFTTLGDFQPDTGEIHLPPMLQKDIYQEMAVDLGDRAVALTTFYKIWKDEFPEVRIPPEQRFGKCKRCAELHEGIMDCKDPTERATLKQQRRQHIRDVRAERLVYHKWRKVCREQPDEYLMVILDGMDQSKTNIPHFNCGDLPSQMTTRVVGAIAHGRTKQSYAYLVTHHTKETNGMIEILGRVLADQGKLPPHLIIQLDNTSTDNKNIKLFSYLAALVETEQVETVTINFLPVGHTHEDIDALFSHISKELKRVGARSIPELQASIEHCIPGITVHWLRNVVDWWSASSHRAVGYKLSKWYSFQIAKRPSDKHTVIRTKVNMRDTAWLPVGSSATDLTYALDMLKPGPHCPALRFVVPNVLPVAILRSSMNHFEGRLSRLRSSIHFPDEQQKAAFDWWMQFLDSEDARLQSMCGTCRDIRQELGSIVVRQGKSAKPGEKIANKKKLQRRKELVESLKSHACVDRQAGLHDVPKNHNAVLRRMLLFWEHDNISSSSRADGGSAAGGSVAASASESSSSSLASVNQPPYACDSEGSDSDVGFEEETDGLQMLSSGRAPPKAYTDRGSLITKGMIVATLPSPDDDDMGGHPFLVSEVTRVSKHHVWLHFYGPNFLETYRPLDDGVYKYRRGTITLLHWNMKLTGKSKRKGGKLSVGDQRVLSLDARVQWRYNMTSNSKKRKKNGSKRTVIDPKRAKK